MRNVKEIFSGLKKIYPDRKFFSDIHVTPYRVLISTILSQRTRDENMFKASEQLFALTDDPKKMLKLKTSQIEKAIKPSGFYRVKAKKIQEVSQVIIEKYKGKVPQDLDELLSLPGVGRKTANCVLLFAYRIPAIPVDTHLHRISQRLGWANEKTPDATELYLRKHLPKKFWLDINELFVRHGQNVCKPISPQCSKCTITKYCKYYKEVYLKK